MLRVFEKTAKGCFSVFVFFFLSRSDRMDRLVFTKLNRRSSQTLRADLKVNQSIGVPPLPPPQLIEPAGGKSTKKKNVS